MMAQSRLCVLGKFALELGQVVVPSLATQKARSLLAYLITHRQSDVGRERLLEVLWPEIDPERAKGGLRSALWSIRRAIRDAGFEPDDCLSANRSVIRWHAQTELDAETFMALARSEDPQQLDKALALYKGDYLEGDYEEWAVAERARLSTAYESVLSRLVRIAGSHEAAQLLVGLNPYDEPAYMVLIKAELSAGRVVAAEALGERCERALAEVGARPSKDLLQLFSGVSSRHIQSTPKLVLPFVGREVDLARVRDCLVDQSATKPAFLISGEPGIGKSAFLSHAAEIARSLGRPVVSVACFEGDLRTFGPFEDLYTDLCDAPLDYVSTSHEVDAAQQLAVALASGLEAHTIVMLDDAQTLAPDAVRVLSILTPRLCARGVTPVIATRTEGRQLIASALASCSCENITLRPLRLEEVREGIDAVVADNPEKVAAAIFERSGGHPLFTKTLIDSMAQSGLLRPEKGMWHLVGELDDRVPLPTSLTSYIQTRLRARGEAASAVAAALALEPNATADDIIAALNLPESKVFDALDDLLALGVVVQPVSGPELAFAHELYREVAAKSLNVGRRSRLHRAFAERFALSRSKDSTARRARHLSLAGDTLNAAEAYYHAAFEALELRAWLEARDRSSAGIACLETVEHTPTSDVLIARLKLLSAKALAALGDSSSAIASAGDAMTIAKRSGESNTMLHAALARQRALLDEYEADAALAYVHETTAQAREVKDDLALSIALADQSCAHRLLADEAEAISAAEEAERVANSLGEADLACYALEQLILAHVTWWRFSDGIRAAARSERAIITASSHAKIAVACARAILNISLGLHQDAASSLAACDAMLHEDPKGSKRVFGYSPFGPMRQKFALSAVAARLALDRAEYDSALTATRELEQTNIPRAHVLAELFQADALFESATPNSVARSGLPLAPPSTGLFLQDVYSGSRLPVISDALVATTMRSPDVSYRLTCALNATEGASRRAPLDAERAYAQLARAADISGVHRIAARARLRCDRYIELRAAARSAATAPVRLESTAR